MYQKVKAYVEEQHMLEKKDRVIVGVSGGRFRMPAFCAYKASG